MSDSFWLDCNKFMKDGTIGGHGTIQWKAVCVCEEIFIKMDEKIRNIFNILYIFLFWEKWKDFSQKKKIFSLWKAIHQKLFDKILCWRFLAKWCSTVKSLEVDNNQMKTLVKSYYMIQQINIYPNIQIKYWK